MLPVKIEVCLRWLLAVVIHLVLLHSAFELQKNPEEQLLDRARRERGSDEAGGGRRVILTLIGGLEWDLFEEKVKTTRLYKDFISLGRMGEAHSFAEDHLHGMKEVLTGIPGLALDSGVESLSSLTKTLYVGPPSAASMFSGTNCRCFCPSCEWENVTRFPHPRPTAQWIINTVENILFDPSDAVENFINEDKLLMVIYLPNVDMSNMLHGPFSPYTTDELLFTMDSLHRIYNGVQILYNDSKTAFIFTSTHTFPGAKDGHEMDYRSKRTLPFVTWGVALCSREECINPEELNYSRPTSMQLNDIAPLVSFLLGSPIPLHSVGFAPLHCLKDDQTRANASLKNAKQFSELYTHFEAKYDFGWAQSTSPLTSTLIQNYIRSAEDLIVKKDYNKSITVSQELIDVSYKGIDHYREFKHRKTWACVMLSLFCWIVVTLGWIMNKIKREPLIVCELVPQPEEQTSIHNPKMKQPFLKYLLRPKVIVDIVGLVGFLGALTLLLWSWSPLCLTNSCLLVIFLAWLVMKEAFHWIKLYKSNSQVPFRKSSGKSIFYVIFFIIFTMFMEYPLITNSSLLLGLTFTSLTDFRRKSRPYLAFWILSSLPYIVSLHFEGDLSYFPFLSTGALLWTTLSALVLYKVRPPPIDCLLVLMGNISTILIVFVKYYALPKTVLWLGVMSLPAFLLVLIPIVSSAQLPVRLLSICVCVCVQVVLLSDDLEPVMLLFTSVHLFSWLLVEGCSNFDEFLAEKLKIEFKNVPITWSDMRCSVYYFSYLLISVFAIERSFRTWCWDNSWPSTSVQTFLGVFLKTFILTVVINVASGVLGRHNPSGHQAIRLFLSAVASFFNFIFKTEYISAVLLQLFLLTSLLTEPVSIILLMPRLFPATDIRTRRSTSIDRNNSNTGISQ